MTKEQAIKALTSDLMFHGCQKLILPEARELAENIIDNKVPFLKIDDDKNFEERVGIHSEANKNAAIEAMSKFIPEKITANEAFKSEVLHWHKSFVSSCMCSGKGVAESMEDANDAITSLYGSLDFELIAQD